VDGDGHSRASNPAEERREVEHAKLVVVVLVANAELARVAVTIVTVSNADQDIAPPLRLDDVLSFIRRRGVDRALTYAPPAEACGGERSRR